VIERADPATCGQVLARALHERGHVAARRGRLDDAVVYGYRALALYEGAMERDRVLGDIAGALGAAGYHQAAWDGHLVLAATAQAQETRWAAIVNLIELAAWRGNERLFDRYRAELADVALPAWITGYYHLHSGDGFLRFGHRELAIASLERAVEVATQTQLNEVRMQAETLLSTIDRSPTPVFAAASPATPEIAEVIDALHRMHALAGIAAE
jgi:hypothetical protein